MTNFERIRPAIETLFGPDWTPEDFADLYEDAIGSYDCSDFCMIGLTECDHRMGVMTNREAREKGMTDEEYDEYYDKNYNGKVCHDVILEWLLEEAP